MSACNGVAVAVSERRTFFSDTETKYPEVSADGKVDTKQFLDASRTIVKLFDLLGHGFTAVKYDVNGNIEKLEKQYNSNPGRYKTLNDMIRCEIDDGESKFATESLLWLKRALEYTRVFLRCMIEDHKNGTKNENLADFCRLAYESTLKRYHGWVVQKLCALSVRAVPWRRDLMKLLAYGRQGMDDLVIIDMEEFLNALSSNLDVIVKMYDDWGLNSDAKV